MKIVIPGGSGQIGTMIARAFHAEGHEVTVLARSPKPAVPWRWVTWDAATLGSWVDTFEGTDVVINLCGRTVNCRYTPANRRAIINSRVVSTRLIGRAIADAKRPPRLWLQSSTATIYAHRYDSPNDEFTGVIGGNEPDVPETWRFSIDVANQWEAAAQSVHLPNTRLVLLRSAMVMSPDQGGVFHALLRLVRLYLGGASGDGRQFVSWIHETDFLNAVRWVMSHETLAGPVNLASPKPLPNRDFMAHLRRAWGRHVGLPAPAWLLEFGAAVIRTESELILKSRRVVPGRLVRDGFEFRHSEWEGAARDLCAQWRKKY